jgi:hypothetical protein
MSAKGRNDKDKRKMNPKRRLLSLVAGIATLACLLLQCGTMIITPWGWKSSAFLITTIPSGSFEQSSMMLSTVHLFLDRAA